jgi:uncharacterized membrane protein
MGLIMAPAAYHRQAERGKVTRRFVDLASMLLTAAMLPLIVGVCLDTYLIARLILDERTMPAVIAGIVAIVLAGLWYGLPAFCRRLKD